MHHAFLSDGKYIAPIEQTIRECIPAVERGPEAGDLGEHGDWRTSDIGFDAYTPDSIDLDLEGELMNHLIEPSHTTGRDRTR
jgi:hypothetical protein